MNITLQQPVLFGLAILEEMYAEPTDRHTIFKWEQSNRSPTVSFFNLTMSQLNNDADEILIILTAKPKFRSPNSTGKVSESAGD
jgi:hypothetical protein